MTTKNIDYETLCKKISSKVKNTGSHIGDIEFFRLMVKWCRLKPYSIFQQDKTFQKYDLELKWVDEFGNSLVIEKKVARIIIGDVLLDKRVKISSDLFFGRSLDAVAKNSQIMLAFNGEYTKKCCLLTFLGKDNYLRSFLLFDKWFRVSPLLLGLGTLKELYKNYDNVLCKEINLDKCDLLLKFNVISYTVSHEPTSWQNYIAGDLK